MKEKLNTVFSENLKRLRKLEKLTQRDISNILNTDRSAIANYERGARVPPIEVLIAIANHFNVSLDYLILGKRSSESNDTTTNQALINELMAENTALMEAQINVNKENAALKKETDILANLISSLKTYNNLLEDKIR